MLYIGQHGNPAFIFGFRLDKVGACKDCTLRVSLEQWKLIRDLVVFSESGG